MTRAPEASGAPSPLPPVTKSVAKALLRTGLLVVLLVWLASCGSLAEQNVDMGWWPPITLIGAFSVHTGLGVAGLAGVGLIIIGSYLYERSKRESPQLAQLPDAR